MPGAVNFGLCPDANSVSCAPGMPPSNVGSPKPWSMPLVSYDGGRAVHVPILGLAYEPHDYAGTCDGRQRLIPMILS